jgi:hypothetical protein
LLVAAAAGFKAMEAEAVQAGTGIILLMILQYQHKHIL